MDLNHQEKEFLEKVTGVIDQHISHELFGVSELAAKMGMSRSNLLRKIKKLTGLSASQFIRNVRLQRAMDMLKQSSLNVSEVSYEVGFASTSYFIKCFREYYGYPPGEAGQHEEVSAEKEEKSPSPRRKRFFRISALILIGAVLAVIMVLILPRFLKSDKHEKSIAVLPFINDSNDSSNVHIINGLRESILNNLQNIGDLRVISRTSVEKYRNSHKTIPEIARELNARYFVEGSGQKLGDQILLNVQLIDAKGDKHIWAEQYNREATDIFKLQQEVAKNIARHIEVIITPEVEERINKVPTGNLEAYDDYLKGLDLMNRGNQESLVEAIPWFRKAIEKDKTFAHAYAYLAISYFYLDVYQTDKKYLDQLNYNADQALLYDPKLPQSLVAKALYYINTRDFEQAVPFLEKALEYNPNSARVINVLADFYANTIPNTEKYLEYALKGIRLDIAAQDSVTASYTFLHVSNAFIQSGFVKEAEIYINKSLEYNPNNLYSEYVKAYILYAKNKDLQKTKELLMNALSKDSSRLDIMQEVGKIHYYLRDYKGAYRYYKRFDDLRKTYHLDIYRFENAKIGWVFSEMGFRDEAIQLLREYREYAENDRSVYQPLSMAMYYNFKGNKEKALEELRLFSQEENFMYWAILFLGIDPLMDPIIDLPETGKLLEDMKTRFWNHHKKIRWQLEKEGLI